MGILRYPYRGLPTDTVHLSYSSLFCLAPVLTLKDLVGPFCSGDLISEARKIPRKGKTVPWGHRYRGDKR